MEAHQHILQANRLRATHEPAGQFYDAFQKTEVNNLESANTFAGNYQQAHSPVYQLGGAYDPPL